MKNNRKISSKKKLFLILVFFITFNLIDLSSAQQDPGDVSQVIGNEFNISSEKIPTSQEDIEKLRQGFLQKEWTELISKNKVIGPVHNFFSNEKTQIVLKIIFAHPYEISLTFFLILILWLLILIQSTKIVKSSEIIKKELAFPIGIAIAIIFAQLKIIKLIVTFSLDLAFKQENWWIRVIIIIFFLAFVALAYALSGILAQHFKKQKEAKTKKETEQELSNMKRFSTGIKESD